jgi:enamine deaminase RidA (YjgF/YER057c/UK114 family)
LALTISGQIPESKMGEVPESFKAQAELVWANVRAKLAADSMTTAGPSAQLAIKGRGGIHR